MNVELKKLPKSRVSLKGSFSAEEFSRFIAEAEKHFVEEAELPGFRKGKAPAHIVVSKVGEAKILEEAANLALSSSYGNILREHTIEAIGKPEIRITKLARGNPLEWEADISVIPEVALPDYAEIAKKKNGKPEEPEAVSEEEVAKSLEWLRQSRKTADAEGKETLPELNDEFAKTLGKFETLEVLKNLIRDNIRTEKTEKAKDKHKLSILEEIAEKSSMEIPDILLESEKEKMLHELESNVLSMGMQWEDYLGHIKKTGDELKKDWDADAKKRVSYGLVLREIAKKENLSPSDEDLSAWADDYLRHQEEDVRKSLDRERVKDYAYGILRNEKVFNFLENIKE